MNIKPIVVAAGTLFSSVVATELTNAEGSWLLVAIGVLAFLALLLNNSLGAIQKAKALRQGAISPTPLPVIVEKSLSEKFVDTPSFKSFTEYVHKSNHEIKNEIKAVKNEGELRGKEMEDLARDLNKQNELRSSKIHDRINTVAEEMPGKIIKLLRD